jgi:hypothetical protein
MPARRANERPDRLERGVEMGLCPVGRHEKESRRRLRRGKRARLPQGLR